MEEEFKPENPERVFKGVLFDVYHWQQKQFDGSMKTFEMLKRLPGAAVIPVLPSGKLLIATDEQPGRPTVLTFPGGNIEENETPEAGAARELLEETGYQCDELILLKKSNPFTKIDWPVYLFVGRGAKKVAEPVPDPGEIITLQEITLDELIEQAENPRFQNKDLVIDLIKAKYDPEERKLLEQKIFG